MEIFELLAIHPFSSINELNIAYADATKKIDPMKQADINALDRAYQQAIEILTREPKPGHFLELVQSSEDLIYLLSKFPEHGYQMIAYLDNNTCQFGMDMDQVMNAFSRSSIAASAVSNPKTGLIAGIFAAGTQIYQQGRMQMQNFSPLARLVLSNFDAVMTSIEPSLVLCIGFHLCEYRDFISSSAQFQKNTSSAKILSAGKAFFSGNVSLKPLVNSLWSKTAQERTRHLLAYVESIFRLECELNKMSQLRALEIKSAVDALFSALKYTMIIDMQHVDIDTLQRNQQMIPKFYRCIESSCQQLNSLGASDILRSLEDKLPFAFKVHLSNALMIHEQKLLPPGQSHEALEYAGGGLNSNLDDGNVSSEDDEASFFDCNVSSIAYGYIELETNPFKTDCKAILSEVLSLIDATLKNYSQMPNFNQNPNRVTKGRYLIKIQAALSALLRIKNDEVLDDVDVLEKQRKQIQAYCHLLQYVTNIETGTFSGCTTKITESLDEKTSFRLTGTKTHENLIDVFRAQYHFCFDENAEAKKQFLTYVHQGRNPEFIIQQLGLGQDPKLGKIQPPSPKQFLQESVSTLTVRLPVLNHSVRQLAWGLLERFTAWLEHTSDLVREQAKTRHSP